MKYCKPHKFISFTELHSPSPPSEKGRIYTQQQLGINKRNLNIKDRISST